MTTEKRGFKIQMGLEMYAALDPDAPQRKGHYEPRTPTRSEVDERKRAVKALAELEKNRFVAWPRMDDDIRIESLRTEEHIFDETHEEYMERLKRWWEERA